MKNQSKHRPFRTRVLIGLVCLMLFTPTLSLGWGAGGHMMTAQIAFDRLNPRAKAQVKALLEIPINPADVSRRSKNFIHASHWADDLRPFPEFDSLKPLHFIDIPFSIDGSALPSTATPNIVTALEENVNILKTSTDQNERAQALRLIIHFVGDIHQPLHCATKVDSTHLEGDRGGNLLKIKITGSDGQPKTTNLHSYWDGGLTTFPPTGPNFAPPPLSQVSAAAARAKLGNPATDRRLHLDDAFNFQMWADESFALAQDVVYKGIANNGRPTTAYKNKGVKVARQRVAWGGYRLAALLNAIWP